MSVWFHYLQKHQFLYMCFNSTSIFLCCRTIFTLVRPSICQVYLMIRHVSIRCKIPIVFTKMSIGVCFVFSNHHCMYRVLKLCEEPKFSVWSNLIVKSIFKEYYVEIKVFDLHYMYQLFSCFVKVLYCCSRHEFFPVLLSQCNIAWLSIIIVFTPHFFVNVYEPD